MKNEEYRKAIEKAEAYFRSDYETEDYKVIAEYFGREIAAAIYRKNITARQRETMKKIFLNKTKEAPHSATPKEVVKALGKELV